MTGDDGGAGGIDGDGDGDDDADADTSIKKNRMYEPLGCESVNTDTRWARIASVS